ncbi:MAG: sigma factor, partial [Planctomycetota bacterium]|nr:sigma factor [Planctomycetota bacterium]
MDDDEGSITHWIGALKAGDAAGQAADHLWRRYFADLVRLARGKLGSVSRATADEEDVALSAFHSLCKGMAADRFPKL